jgi:hypothetical protein
MRPYCSSSNSNTPITSSFFPRIPSFIYKRFGALLLLTCPRLQEHWFLEILCLTNPEFFWCQTT